MFENRIKNPAIFNIQDSILSEFFSKVYTWMTVALLISGSTAYYIGLKSKLFLPIIKGNSGILIALIILQFAVVIALSFLINKISYKTSVFLFLLYSLITGVIFSTLFLIYSPVVMAKAFIITSTVFASMAIYGRTTKRNLSAFGSFLFMSLIGLIVASVVNIFISSFAIDWIITYAGILIFAGLVAYDNYKMKAFALMYAEGSEESNKIIIRSALSLYLDFINLFLFILRAMNR